MHAIADYLIGIWIDQLVLAGFTHARWWAQVSGGQPLNGE